jgi:hypothetical protein
MPFNYQDFFPLALKRGIFSTVHEPLPATVARANQWVAKFGVRVVNVETVVLPNIDSVGDASQVGIRTSGGRGSYWYQIVRVWYETPSPVSPVSGEANPARTL